MLELIDIKKDYEVGDNKVPALKGVNLFFGKNEFVSILGPSGCGKTTLLNIIGGLDRYTSGKLLINGKSTEEFKNADWDAYRNRCIGFVFQNYNLIPHLTVLGNVELALTLSGISPEIRRKKAEQALIKVGLEKELKKRPNQLSGGQMQRVAIARALVNDPEIILADEPTGALDSKTSVQIMEILKEIASDKLIIMVTHNKSLAEEYSSRIITLLDGEVVSDTASEQREETEEKPVAEKAILKRTSMSFFTALSISMKNLFTKKGRTFMTSFAASIGIIGIALVLAISNGFTEYIDKLQSDTLANYPVTVAMTAMDMETAVNQFQNIGNQEVLYKGEDKAAVYNPTETLAKMQKLNVITKDYVEYIKKLDQKTVNGQKVYNDIQFSFQASMHFMYETEDGIKGMVIESSSSTMMDLLGMSSATMQEVMSNEKFIRSQYDVVYGSYPSEPVKGVHQVAIVVDKYNRLSTVTLNKLGISYEELAEGYAPINYKDLVGRRYKLLANDAYYIENIKDGYSYFTPISTKAQLEKAYDDEKNFELEIVGVMRVKETTPIALYTSGILFLPSLTEEYLKQCKDSYLGKKQSESPDYQLISDFKTNDRIKIEDVMKMTGNAYNLNLSKEQAQEYVKQMVGISDLPNKIYIYPKNFECKSVITDYLDQYNTGKSEEEKINFTDASALLSSTMGQMVDIITYVLIAFACVSLIVSSIMIGIITYASVIERTKEIGVLRSIGARKKDIARVFNAETILIGFVAGLIGILVSYLLCIPINAIIHSLAGDTVTRSLAVLNPLHALILVVISMALTLIGGLIPAMIAAKKDPVVALRTE